MSPLDIHEENFHIDVYCVFTKNEYVMRMSEIKNKKFNIYIIPTFQEAVEKCKKSKHAALLLDKSTYEENRLEVKNRVDTIVIGEERLCLTNGAIKRIPESLFLESYLEEFIYWCVERAEFVSTLSSNPTPKTRKSRLETLLNELHEVSRASVLPNVKTFKHG